MKLLLVIPEYHPHPGGGIATYYESLLPLVAARGHTVDVLLASPHTVGTDERVVNGVRVSMLRPALYAKYRAQFRRFNVFPVLRDQLAAAWGAWEQAEHGRGYDLVEAADWGLGFVPWIVGDTELPVRVRLHGSTGQIEQYDPRAGNELQAGIFRLVEMSVLRHAEALATHSRTNQAFWQELLERPVEFRFPGLALPARPDPSEPAQPLSEGLVVGRVQYWKGPTVVCDALRAMRGSRPHLTWVGRDTPYREHRAGTNAYLLEQYPDVWGSVVTRREALPPPEIFRLQARAGFGLVPSTWDVFNLVCVEFMALGRPVVCSTGAGAAGLISDGENGFLFAAGDAAGLGDALERLVASASRLGGISDAARETVVAELEPSRHAEHFVERSAVLIHQGRRSVRPESWLEAFVTPSTEPDDHRAILDQLPLRELARYNVRRGLSRVVGR